MEAAHWTQYECAVMPVPEVMRCQEPMSAKERTQLLTDSKLTRSHIVMQKYG